MSATLARRSAVAGALALRVAALARPHRAAASPGATPIAALDARLRAVWQRRDEIDSALMRTPDGAAWPEAVNREFDRNLDEMLALHDEILARPAITSEDAASQAFILLCKADQIEADLECEVGAFVRQVRAVAASIVLAIAAETGLDVDRLGGGGQRYLCDLHVPRECP